MAGAPPAATASACTRPRWPPTGPDERSNGRDLRRRPTPGTVQGVIETAKAQGWCSHSESPTARSQTCKMPFQRARSEGGGGGSTWNATHAFGPGCWKCYKFGYRDYHTRRDMWHEVLLKLDESTLYPSRSIQFRHLPVTARDHTRVQPGSPRKRRQRRLRAHACRQAA